MCIGEITNRTELLRIESRKYTMDKGDSGGRSSILMNIGEYMDSNYKFTKSELKIEVDVIFKI